MTIRTLPPSAYEKLTTAVARDTGERRTAALWIHAAGLVRHAQDHGLLPDTAPAPGPDGLRKSLEILALPSRPRPAGRPGRTAGAVAAARRGGMGDSPSLLGPAPGPGTRAPNRRLRPGPHLPAALGRGPQGRALCQAPPWIARLLIRLSLEPPMEE
ncbi:hypothetical protein OG800_49520 (plasmid) [Streptomyces sp. NBC_00445]|uniref:hypothetical protein n=1 Tax=Streptomyces sp. NBC_00445 TaxID=2975745 RepID=UPI002E200D4B